jgi:hypothetical protein
MGKKMFWRRKKIKETEEVKQEEVDADAESVEKKKKIVNLFDDWGIRHKKFILRLRDIENRNNPYVRELWSLYEFGDRNYRDVLKKKNELLKEEFISENTIFCADSVEWYRGEIAKCERIMQLGAGIKNKQDYFMSCVNKLIKHFDKNKDYELKRLLFDYAIDGDFLESDVKALRAQKYGFWKWVFCFIGIWRARCYLDWFVEYFGVNNICKQALSMFRMPYGMDIGYVLVLRLNTIVNYDYDTSQIWLKKYDYEIKKMNRRMKFIIKDIDAKDKMISKGVLDCEASILENEELLFVEKYFKEKSDNAFKFIRNELNNDENGFVDVEHDLSLMAEEISVVSDVLDDIGVGRDVIIEDENVEGKSEIAHVLEEDIKDKIIVGSCFEGEKLEDDFDDEDSGFKKNIFKQVVFEMISKEEDKEREDEEVKEVIEENTDYLGLFSEDDGDILENEIAASLESGNKYLDEYCGIIFTKYNNDTFDEEIKEEVSKKEEEKNNDETILLGAEVSNIIKVEENKIYEENDGLEEYLWVFGGDVKENDDKNGENEEE